MRTSLRSLSGKRFLVRLFTLIFSASAIVSLLFIIWSKKEQTIREIKLMADKDFTPIINKMYDKKENFKNSRVPGFSYNNIDEKKLQQSDWFKSVQDDIQKRSYFIIADESTKTFSSVNHVQNLKTNYTAGKFMLEPFALNNKKEPSNKSNWQLNISVNGIYADGRLINGFNTNSAVSSTNEIEYNFNNIYTIQYHNDAKGIRQNFIIKEKPFAEVHDLRIRMKAEGDWVVNKVYDKELHFSKLNNKGTLDSKIVYNDLKAWDANGKPLIAKMEVSGKNNFEIIANVENARFPITVDPLSSSPSSTLTGFSANSLFGGSIASAGDVNGDGYSDVIVGAPETAIFKGAVYIYLGSASGLASSPATTITGVSSGDDFGVSVASIGDINGDGFGDVIIGASGVSSSRGAVYFFIGSSSGIASGTSASASVILSGTSNNDNFGLSVANAGDINGDGYSDVIVGAPGVSSNTGAAYIYTGSSNFTSSPTLAATLNGSASPDAFGVSVSSAGDVNGDGYSDIVIGAYGHSLGTGAAYIFNSNGGSGIANNASPSATLNGLSAGDAFGGSVASAGDINGDGYSDVIIGASKVSGNTGAAYIFAGSISGIANGASPSTTLSGISTGDRFGFSVSGAGDMNGDAYADVIIGAYAVSSNTGAAYVYEGASTGISNSATPALTLNGANAGDSYGFSVTCIGDVNGDGISDVLVGAPNSTTSTGVSYAYTGNPDVSSITNTVSIVGNNQLDRFALSVSGAGDINGDGYGDVIVGAIGYPSGALTGAAYVYTGGPTGLNTSPLAILTPGITEIGWCVSSGGDINGDGYDDILIGAKYQSCCANIGAVFIYLGQPSGAPVLASTLTGFNNQDLFGYSVANAGDVNGDGYDDIIVGAPGESTAGSLSGAAYIFLGSASGISSSAIPSTILHGQNVDAALGVSVASAGDVNGDGYSDVIVGAPNLGAQYDLEGYGGANTGSGIGSAYVYHGSSSGIANSATPDVLADASTVDFGISVSSAGDVNGDGFSDVIVGASSGDNSANAGTAEVFLGTVSGSSNSASTVLNGVSAGDQFGSTVSTAGDVNGDGYGDVIIRATMPSSTNNLTGESYIFTGGPSGIFSTAAVTFSDEKSNTYLETRGGGADGTIVHRSVAGVGDVNGDGYSDVIIGQYTDSTKGTKTGKAYLYYGNNGVGHNASNVFKLYETNLTNPIAADNLTQPKFGLGLSVQSPFGTVKGRLVWETEANGIAFQGNPITNSVYTTAKQNSYALISAGGTEFKNLVDKSPAKATKVRARIQYASTAVTFGQVYSPWIYSQAYLLGNNIGVLPLDLLSFTAKPVGQDIILNWKASGEKDLSVYVVEHSTDGVTFDSLGYVASKGTTGTSSYDFTHYHPSVGIHYYRLREVDKDGKKTYSEVVSAKINGSVEFSIYPNPASDHIVIIHTGINSNYVRILNSAGAVVGQYQLNSNNTQTTISLSGYARGNYFVDLINSGFAPKQITIK